MTFAEIYRLVFVELMHSPDLGISCRGLKISREIVNAAKEIEIHARQVSIFSHPTHRVIPIKFALAELCYILAGRFDLQSIASYNKAMANYSDDGLTIGGSYGVRLDGQLDKLIERLEKDPQTRQACAAIYSKEDCLSKHTHLPCNVFLQFMNRERLLYMIVTSRSSDFVTGFSIDTFHWQAMLIMMANELNLIPSTLYYNIGSLHIYSADVPIVEQWKIGHPYVDYRLTFPLKLSHAITRCKKHFEGGMAVGDMAQLLGLDGDALELVDELEMMFTKYRNKLTR